MRSNSSTSSSETLVSAGPGASDFFARVRTFLLPFLILPVLAVPFLLSGELVPVSVVAWAQSRGVPLLFLQKYSDHNFGLKVTSANMRKAEVVVLGSSRTNQWRSKQFAPYTFYNAGNTAARLGDIAQFLAKLEYDPKVIIFSLDYFMFSDSWSPESDRMAKGDIEYPHEAAYILTQLARSYVNGSARLSVWPKEPNYSQWAVGLSAQNGVGFRLDGSYQYGTIYRGMKAGAATPDDALQRIEKGVAPFIKSAKPDAAELSAFRELVNAARKRGIALVGVTTSYNPVVVDAIERSADHGLWRLFRSAEFRSSLESLGVITFDFTDIGSYDGRAAEFIDAFHPSEPSLSRQLLAMMKRPEMKALLPEIRTGEIAAALQQATEFEVYRNSF